MPKATARNMKKMRSCPSGTLRAWKIQRTAATPITTDATTQKMPQITPARRATSHRRMIPRPIATMMRSHSSGKSRPNGSV